jgi:hypothetical protein
MVHVRSGANETPEVKASPGFDGDRICGETGLISKVCEDVRTQAPRIAERDCQTTAPFQTVLAIAGTANGVRALGEYEPVRIDPML